MKLNKEQLIRIRNFVNSRGFTFYDVQLEIIDHVACKVEERMTADPGLTLDMAIAQTHAGFGVMGFSVLEDAMHSSLQKRYWKLFRTTFLSYLKPVYLPLEAGLIYLVYLSAKLTGSPDVPVDLAWGTAFLLLLIYVLINYRKVKKYKRMLSVRMGGIVALVINLPLQLYIYLPNMARSFLAAGASSIAMGVFLTFIIIVFITLQQLQKTALNNCRELEEQYTATVGGEASITSS